MLSLRITLLASLYLFSSISSANCWIDEGKEPGAGLQAQHYHSLLNLAKTNPQCSLVGVSAHEAFMFYNRDSGEFWEMKVTGVDLFNNTSPLVRSSMDGYFQVEWKSIGPLEMQALAAKNKDELWKAQSDMKRRGREPQFKEGHESMNGKLPLAPSEKAFLKESLPRRFQLSYFRGYIG